MKPHSQDEHKQQTFEYFCKQILKNERNDYHRELNQQGEREVLFCELPPHTVERFAMWDKYFQDQGLSVTIPTKAIFWKRYSPYTGYALSALATRHLTHSRTRTQYREWKYP